MTSATELTVRAATRDDVPWMLEEEAQTRTDKTILGWPEGKHLKALADRTIEYRIYADATSRVGFVILEGLGSVHRCIELTRIIAARSGHGIGRAMMHDTMRHVFNNLGAHRLWLLVFTDNERALRIYRKLGFVQEGMLREPAQRVDGFKDAYIFGMLEQEWRRISQEYAL